MAKDQRCQECGRTVPGDAPSSICPRCLLKRGFESGDFKPATPPPNRDRNLLFGVFGIQLGMVSKDAFVEAAASWAVDPSKAVPERLLAMEAITREQMEFLENITDEAIRHHGNNERAALDSVGGELYASRVIQEAGENDTGKSLSTALGLPPYVQDVPPEEILAVEERPGRYTKPSEYSRGGMGRVLVVHDEFLSREIALKELLPPPLDKAREEGREPSSPMRASSAFVARFLREAKVTGQLEHPSIVPVYELGRRDDGTLYYTMKLVRGNTLKKELKAASDLESRLKLLNNFIDLCQAIAYAHSRGVIHRDIKPTNIMLGGFGETVVIDWGLAKVIGRPDEQENQLRKTIQLMRGKAPEKIGVTQTGLQLGTPAYMAPEQVEGKISELDERTDVFALGVVLYEILTGRVPFEGKTTADVMSNILDKEPRPIRALEPQAPPELIGICEKAIRKDPEERYQSAQELAEEVTRFQTGALVRAHTYTLGEMLRRYYRRHRPIINTVAAAILVLLAAGVYSYISIRQARDDEMAARQRETVARQEAERAAYVSQIRLAEKQVADGDHLDSRATLWATQASQRNWEWGFLLNESHPEQRRFKDFVGFAFHPSGARMATFSRTEPVTVWRLDDGAELTTIEPGATGLLMLNYSSDGSRLVAPSLYRYVYVWDANSGELIHQLQGHTDVVEVARFNASDTRIVSGARDGTVRIWDAASGQLLLTYEGHDAPVVDAEFSPDSRYVLSRSWLDATVKLWDASSGAERATFAAQKADLSPTGELIASAMDSVGELWDVDSGESVARFEGHTAVINSIQFNSAGDRVLTGAEDGTARIWAAPSGELELELSHGDSVVGAAFSPNGRWVLTHSMNGPVKVWDARAGNEVNALPGHVKPIFDAAFHPSSGRMATSSIDQTVRVWNTRGRLSRHVIRYARARAVSAAASQDRHRVAVMLDNKTVEVVDVRDGTPQAVLAAYRYGGGTAASLDQGGSRLVAVLDAFTPMVFDLETGSLVSRFDDHEGWVSTAALSPDGSRVATAGWEGTVRIWDAESGQELGALRGYEEDIVVIAYRADGEQLASLYDDGRGLVWNPITGERVHALHGDEAPLLNIQYSPDGEQILASSAAGITHIWDAATGERLSMLNEAARSLDLFHDGERWLLNTGDRLTIFDGGAKENLVSVDGAGARLVTAFFHNGTNAIVGVSSDGAVRQWHAAPYIAAQLPGDASTPWEERYALYQQERYATINQGFQTDAEPTMAVVAAPDILANRFQRFRNALGAHEAEAVSGPGILLTEGPLQNALARLCFMEGDRIVAINGTALEGIGDAMSVLEELVTSESLDSPITMRFVRNGVEREVRILLTPRVDHTRELRLDRKVAASMLQTLYHALVENRGSVLSWQQVRAADVGEAVRGANAMSGFWLQDFQEGGDETQQQVEACYRAFGLSPFDRLITIDGQPIRNYRHLRDKLDALSEGINTGELDTFSIEFERGEFRSHQTRVTFE